MFFVFFYSVLFQFSALMSDTAVSQGLFFAFATCLMLTSEYYFSLLSFVNIGKCHILVHDFRGKLTLPLPRFLLVFTKIGIIHKISQCDDSEGLHEYCYILNDDPDEGRRGVHLSVKISAIYQFSVRFLGHLSVVS